MRNLKWFVITLIIFLAIFFNIERLDISGENVINVSSFVYGIGICSIILIIGISRLGRLPAAAMVSICLAVYFFCKLLIFNHQHFLGGIHTYLTITEISLLSILVYLAHRVGCAFNEFEDAVESVSFSSVNGRVKSADEVMDTAKAEMTRSRRFNRPLSVMIVEPESVSLQAALNRMVRDVQQTIMTRYAFALLGNLICGLLRRTDLIMEQSKKGRFVLLCPETSNSHNKVLAKRIQALAAKKMNIKVTYGFATFPDEALTFDDLVHKAESYLKPISGVEVESQQGPEKAEVKTKFTVVGK